MSEPNDKIFDAEYLKGLTDIVKNKTLFFIPFFGAYLAFLLTKTEYIKSANFVIWLIIATIFFFSVRYIHLVSQLLWSIETCRMIFTFHKIGIDPWTDKEKDIATFSEVMKLIPKMVTAEDWWFKKIMFLMYLGTFCVLQDIFFGKYTYAFAEKMTAFILSALGVPH
jgi:hypothetical protein